jgi:glycosyltransferase involved in cell wall biosynthesis
MSVTSLTVLIGTYNRASLLRETLAALQEMTPPRECALDIVVVDNNSSDDTAAVVRAGAGRRFPVAYLFEPAQGKSFALNRGLSHAAGDVIALTDDDVLPAPDWAARIVEAFRESDATFVFGKVLPRWERTPPPELLTDRAQAIWGPLAIVDYGDAPLAYRPESLGQRLPIGANLSILRSALMTIGGWRTDLGKVNNTLIAGEDHEIFARLRRHGLYRGVYDPKIVVRHHVPGSRLTRRYFRQWFYWHGKTRALMLHDLYPEIDFARARTVAGVPRFLYRQTLEQCLRYVRTLGRRDALAVLHEELHTIQHAGLLLECWRRFARDRTARRRGTGTTPLGPSWGHGGSK